MSQALRVALFTTVLITISWAATQPQPPNSDAEALNQTLAKIVFAHEVEIINQLSAKTLSRETPQQLQEALAAEKLQLSATDISAGSVSSIIHRTLADLITSLPNNRMLNVGNATMDVSNEKGLVGRYRLAPVSWDGGDNPRSPFPAAYTFEDAIKELNANCTRYITGSISVSYKGETAQWKPLYLLGCDKGEVVALDLVMVGAVPNFWQADVYPYDLLRDQGGIRGRVPAVQEWLKAHASARCSGQQTCYENGSIVVPQDQIPPLYVPTQ